MSRPCGPCSDQRRNEINRRLLAMESTGETYRVLARDYGYHVDALRRHRMNHLGDALDAIRAAKEQARARVLKDVGEREMAVIKNAVEAGAVDSLVSRLEVAEDCFGQLRVLRMKAAELLDLIEDPKDFRSAAPLLREIREGIRIEVENRGHNQQQMTASLSPAKRDNRIRELIKKYGYDKQMPENVSTKS